MFWSREDVSQWLRWAEREFSLHPISSSTFEMNGKALLLLTKEDFRYRSPRSGDVLYELLQHILKQRKHHAFYPSAFFPGNSFQSPPEGTMQQLKLEETVRRTPRGTEPLPLHTPTIELRHRPRSPHVPARHSPHPELHLLREDPPQVASQLPDSNHHSEEHYPLSVSPAERGNGRCATPLEVPRTGSPCPPEGPRVIQLMPSAIMHPLVLNPRGGAVEFRHSRMPFENGRETKGPSLNLAPHQREELLYRNHVMMPVSPPEDPALPMGRIAGKRGSQPSEYGHHC
ncbi:hypothetical protein JZ751_019719 [Albula glossodonta]|uniref:PNT domain-containing protein n=1 Tax=Albula glossodonta TaxID=121402 RepID=A0A8T2MT55_9TELE|nr:hypothetical protein JZ751_019719 [Albula glossodonta]